MTKKNKKCPKYIYKKSNGYRVQIVSLGIDKTFTIKEYGSDKVALDAAIYYLKEESENAILLKQSKQEKRRKYSVQTAFEDSITLYARSYETNRKLTVMFNKYFSDYKDVPIKEIQPSDVYGSLNNLAASGSVSTDTLSRIRSIWKQIFDAAILNKKALTNYAASIPLPKVRKIEVRREVMNYDEDLLDKVIAAIRLHTNTMAKNKFDAELIVFSLLIQSETGIRPSECYALTRDDIDFNKRIITINKRVGSTQNENNKIVTPKTSNAYRIVPMSNACIDHCTQLMEYTESFQLFERWNGKLLESNFVTTKLRNACKKEGIEFRPYMLRHRFAKSLIDNDISQRTTMDLMGHATYSQSLDYSRTTDEQLLEAIEKISK